MKTIINMNTPCPQLEFALGELKKALAKAGKPPARVDIYSGEAPKGTGAAKAQGYTLQINGDTLIIAGADIPGAMYGVLDMAQHFTAGGDAGTLKAGTVNPYIEQRGIKFNIPLDARTPSYTDGGDSAQENIANVWDMDFWRGFLDRMALNKYNVLSLWSLSPFPSLVKIPKYPETALNDVMRATYVPNATTRGMKFFTDMQENSLVTIKKMTIEEKIQFWQEVMRYAADRCISVYLFTWNVYVYGTQYSSYGISDSADNAVTRDYMRCAVEALVRTYPLLRGIGITAGENMRLEWKIDVREDIQWMRAVYGQAIMDALKDQPDRPFTLIHRSHMTTVEQMEEVFADFPYEFELSNKYSMAHMYSAVKPHFGDKFFAQLKNGRKAWLTLRDDDFYLLRWGDVNFARDYLRSMPADLLRGFYMGPDGIVWGRDYAPRDPGQRGTYFFDRHWFSFALWGRLSYNMDLPDAYFRALWTAPFGDEGGTVYEALKHASAAVPLQQRILWRDFDMQWYPEAGVSYFEEEDLLVFRSINDFIKGAACPGTGHLSIGEYCDAVLGGKAPPGEKPEGITPLEISDELEKNCLRALELLKTLRGGYPAAEASLIADIGAMSHLGLHYAYKFRAAVNLQLFRKTGDAALRDRAVADAEQAVENWAAYSGSVAERYRPQRLSRLRNSISPDMFDDCARLDVVIARGE
ncbi:hypothetical protein FACS1894109_06850 [Spirochaetia bacterium]|nr:hypothetical protein FACS1894109_06850 [Spirochaetia bacterium]